MTVSNVGNSCVSLVCFHRANEFPGDRAWRGVAAGGTGDHFRDRPAGALRAGHQRPLGDARPAVAAGEGLLGAGAGVHPKRGIQEDRAGDGYRGGPGRGAGMAGRLMGGF